MGGGKTEWAISYMNAHPEMAFIFVTPFLDEVERIKAGTIKTFYEPQKFQRTDLLGGSSSSKSKLKDFNDLLSNGWNVATTHKTFTNATPETINILQDNAYHLILDETVDVLVPLNDIIDSPQYRINKKSLRLMLDNGIISVDANRRVHWTGGVQPLDGKEQHPFCEVQRHAENGTLILIDEKLFAWEFSPEVFGAMESVTILTYQMEGSFMHPYMQLYGMDYDKFSTSGNYEAGFELAPYVVNMEQRKKWKGLITLYKDPKEAELGALSATWYKDNVRGRQNMPEATELRRALRRYFLSVGAEARNVMWTCPKDCRDIVAVKGFKLTRELTADEKKGRTQAQLNEYVDENGLRCWVASTARATNKYKSRHILAYLLNFNPNPELSKYFGQNGAPLSRDAFALAGLIQWVWRSAIRDGEPITLWLPSPRMRRLFTEWLDSKR